MFKRLEQMKKDYEQVEKQLCDPELMKDMKRYTELGKEHSYLRPIIELYQKYLDAKLQVEESKEIIEIETDKELIEMAQEEIDMLEEELDNLEKDLRVMLIPKDPLDGKNIIMEIRAGTGGDEAALFAADLYRMYIKFAELKKWKTEIIYMNENELGGFKEISFSIAGKEVYGNLKFESGVHRVQRVPVTESGGRIHTSAVTVAVLPEAEETDIIIRQEDLKIDVFRSSGPGGQSVNTTDSAVRVTHLPTGLVVICQDEKSQIKNKAKALRVLRARLLENEEQKKHAEMAANRKSQVGSGDRSERIRTYNFPQNRVTDHRINLTLYKLEYFLLGELEEILTPLKITLTEEKLKTAGL
ncbi:MAG: peptide chain release factor 1 [Spirochaetales bacterium]|nr:peptide chain release factor 1 [Spirochaetales bacterium]